MAEGHSKATIISMAVLASAAATLLHEGLGHGVTAWLRGDIPTQLTSNHLSSLRPDRWVAAGGTLVNLFAGAASLWASRVAGTHVNLRYFFWILAALNLLPGAGYFLLSGIVGFGDWQEVIRGLPHQVALRTAMAIFGAVLYVFAVRLLAVAVRPFCPRRATYNVVGRLPYYAACLFSCAAGAFDGSSGLLWADSLLPAEPSQPTLMVHRQRKWWIAAAVLGLAYIVVLGRGIQFAH